MPSEIKCPVCGGDTVTLASSGYLFCSVSACACNGPMNDPDGSKFLRLAYIDPSRPFCGLRPEQFVESLEWLVVQPRDRWRISDEPLNNRFQIVLNALAALLPCMLNQPPPAPGYRVPASVLKDLINSVANATYSHDKAIAGITERFAEKVEVVHGT